MPISRGEGYARAAGKEEGGLVVAESFLATHVGAPVRRITDPAENYERGDFAGQRGTSIECKRQPIGRYRQNFIEVCEETAKAEHSNGFARLTEILDVSADALAVVRVKDHRFEGQEVAFGRPPSLAVSVASLRTAAFWLYVNPDAGRRFMYVYPAAELLARVRAAALEVGMERGKGNSNEDTFAVLVPNPAWRWTGSGGQPWRWIGDGDEAPAIEALREALN